MIIAALLLCHGKGNTNLLCPTTSIFMATSDLRTVKDHVSSLANAIPTGMTEKYYLSIQMILKASNVTTNVLKANRI